jgi:hypothetical protein
MFGSEPPPGLFLVEESKDEDMLPSEENRLSIATLLSLSSVDLLSTSPTPAPIDSTTTSRFPESDTPPEEGASDPASTPPFASLVHAVSDLQAPSPETSLLPSAMVNFRERRRRAAKLSRFFGVGYQDLTSSIEVPESLVVRKVAHPRSDSAEEEESKITVDVKVSEPARFWGLSDGRQNLQEADVAEGNLLLLCPTLI